MNDLKTEIQREIEGGRKSVQAKRSSALAPAQRVNRHTDILLEEMRALVDELEEDQRSSVRFGERYASAHTLRGFKTRERSGTTGYLKSYLNDRQSPHAPYKVIQIGGELVAKVSRNGRKVRIGAFSDTYKSMGSMNRIGDVKITSWKQHKLAYGPPMSRASFLRRWKRYVVKSVVEAETGEYFSAPRVFGRTVATPWVMLARRAAILALAVGLTFGAIAGYALLQHQFLSDRAQLNRTINAELAFLDEAPQTREHVLGCIESGGLVSAFLPSSKAVCRSGAASDLILDADDADIEACRAEARLTDGRMKGELFRAPEPYQDNAEGLVEERARLVRCLIETHGQSLGAW